MFGTQPKIITDKENIEEILERGRDEIVDKGHLEERLKSGKQLRIKLGIDPTSPNIHIGRAVVLWKLRAFQDMGHIAVLIIGDFTGLVGDTSDKSSERPMLTEEQVKSNMQNYLEQAFKILDSEKTEIHYNSEWLKKLGFMEVAKMAELFGLHEFESREVISRRMKDGKRVSLREILYPLMQGYDSVAVKADVELGGSDQWFNLLAGRSIQTLYKQEPQDILTMHLLEGTDKRKMSSSWGNVINITDEPNDMFGKVMSIYDGEDGLVIRRYLERATRIPMDEVKELENNLKNGVNPRDIKKRLAEEIVALYYGKEVAKKASNEWENVFSKKELPENIQKFAGEGQSILDFIADNNLAESRSEAKRLLEQKAVKVNLETVIDWGQALSKGDIVQVGPRKFAKVK